MEQNNSLEKHWTERSTKAFVHSIASDFIRFIESSMDAGVTQAKLASILNVSEGRVSQVLNNPGNMTLKKVVEYARALGKKVAIVGYDDGDPGNTSGPVPAEVFAECWARLGKPKDLFGIRPRGAENRLVIFVAGDDHLPVDIAPHMHSATRPADNYLRSDYLRRTPMLSHEPLCRTLHDLFLEWCRERGLDPDLSESMRAFLKDVFRRSA